MMTGRDVQKLLDRGVYQDSEHMFSFLLLENLAVPSYASRALRFRASLRV